MISMRVNEIFNYLSKEEELLKKCHQCMEIIVCAKDRQAAEANKNATILLEEIDQERSREESKRAAAARKREKKKQKKKEKQELKVKEKKGDGKNNSTQDDDDDDDEEDDDDDDVVIKTSAKKCSAKIEVTKTLTKVDHAQPLLRKQPENEISSSTEKNALLAQNGTKTKNKRNKRQTGENTRESKTLPPSPKTEVEAPRMPPLPTTASKRKAPSHSSSSNKSVSILSTTAIGDLDDFGSLPSEAKAPSRTVNKNHSQGSSHHERTPHKSDKNKVLESYTLLSPKGGKSQAPSPKKGQRKEEGWKEVTRKFKKVPVPSTAISRVIGRGGCNINAIREVSGAHIEVDKAKGQGDRNITIKGSADATRLANNLIMALIKDPDKDIEHIMPKKSKPTTSSAFSNGGSTTVASSSSSSSSSSTTTITTVATTIVSSAISLQKVIQLPAAAQKSQAPAAAALPAHQRLTAASKTSATSTHSNSVMTNIGTFHVGPWGSVNVGAPAPGIPGLARSPGAKVNTGKSPKVVRQLFSSTSDPTSSAVKSTVTYTSPSMAKTKVVTATSPSVSAKVDNKQSVSISTASVSPQPIKQPAATHYSPFEDTLFSQAAERVLLGKKEDGADARLNFATVAAVGVVTTTQSSMLPGASSVIGEDPRMQAKAPGYKAPGRTNSPQIDAEAKFKLQQQQRMSYLQQSAELAKAYRSMAPPSVDTYEKGFRPDGPQMSPCSAASSGHSQSPLMDPMHREEYTTPSQPMTLPRIESNLNPNAPDFTTRPPLSHQLRPQHMQFMNMRQHNHNIAELAQLAMSRGALNDLTQQNIVALAAFSMNQHEASASMGPPPPPPHQFSPAASMKSSAASPPGNSPKDEEGVHHSAGSASPMSSSAPSPTDQIRGGMASAEERRSLQPIGTERSSKKTNIGGQSSTGGMGPLGYGLHNDGASGLWSMSDVGGADWLCSPTPPLVSSAAAAVVSSAVVTTVHMADSQRSMLHTEESLDQGMPNPSMMGSTGTAPVFANGLPAMSLPHFLSGAPNHLGGAMGDQMWNNSAQVKQPQHSKPMDQCPDPKMMWNSWTPPPNM